MQTNGGLLEKILTWQNRGSPSQFAVLICAHNRLIGYSGFFHQEVDGTSEIEIGYRLHPNYWNKGLATEAAQAVWNHAFRALNLSRVISLIHPESAASLRVAEKIRMQFEHKTVFKGFPALVFAISREWWVTNCAA
jgi:ribosomal-protein-alanine N-acetyltransferase